MWWVVKCTALCETVWKSKLVPLPLRLFPLPSLPKPVPKMGGHAGHDERLTCCNEPLRATVPSAVILLCRYLLRPTSWHAPLLDVPRARITQPASQSAEMLWNVCVVRDMWWAGDVIWTLSLRHLETWHWQVTVHAMIDLGRRSIRVISAIEGRAGKRQPSRWLDEDGHGGCPSCPRCTVYARCYDYCRWPLTVS